MVAFEGPYVFSLSFVPSLLVVWKVVWFQNRLVIESFASATRIGVKKQ